MRVSWDVSVRGASGRQRDNARVLRRYQTPHEELLWNELRGRKIEGLKFRRQVPIGQFIVDFLCYEAGLIIEVDGAQHSDLHVREYDHVRTNYLREQGFAVLRFTNREVEANLPSVLVNITTTARSRKNRPLSAPLSPEGAGCRSRRLDTAPAMTSGSR